MKTYDPNIYEGKHTIKITLQQWAYKGAILLNVMGNCKGLSVLQCCDFCDFDTMNLAGAEFLDGCSVEYDEDGDFFRYRLVDDEGNTLDGEGYETDMNNMIVSVEIVSLEEPQERRTEK